jgi:hypothetical protein
VGRAKRVRSKTVELFVDNCARYWGRKLESKESAEVKEVVAKADRNLRHYFRVRVRHCEEDCSH